MKRALAAGVTCVVLAVTLLLSRPQREAPSPPRAAAKSQLAEETIHRMFAAAERGDVDSYLACFTGAERASIERRFAEQPREAFSRALLASVDELKGWVVVQDGDGPPSECLVERIYAHRTERQRFRLEFDTPTWRICAVGPVEPVRPTVPYGTPVWQADGNNAAGTTVPQQSP